MSFPFHPHQGNLNPDFNINLAILMALLNFPCCYIPIHLMDLFLADRERKRPTSSVSRLHEWGTYNYIEKAGIILQ